MPLKLKEEHKGTVVAFNNSGAPLGKRSNKDLAKLIRLAERNPSFFDFFDELPSDEELEEMERSPKSTLHSRREALRAQRQPQPTAPQGKETRTTNEKAGG